MAKVTLPLMGVSASGTIGDALTFGNWKGINYARERVIPANPRSTAQQAQRGLMAFVVKAWQLAPASVQNPWLATARGTGMTGFNLFVKRNLLSLKGQSNLAAFVASPGQSGATNVASISATGGTGTATASVVMEADIPGTTITAVHFALLPDMNPAAGFDARYVTASDSTSPYQASFTGLAAGSYRIFAFSQCVDAKGLEKWGVSVGAAVVVS